MNCLQSLRANFADLIGGTAPVHDVKIIVIGNGRIGKTQICRRLMGQDFDETVPSTHGITVSNAALKMPDDAPDASLNLWDFGGQDLYHGTHSLFMKSRAVFVVVWTPRSEKTEDYIHGEMRFRNQRLPYWLQYVRNLAGPSCPVLLVQNQCDTASDEESDAPADLREFQFPYVQKVHYSAKKDRRRASLDEALREAIGFLRNADGIASIGKGRMKVREQLRKWQHKDSQQPESKRRHRTVTQVEFLTLCRKAGNISSPESLLQYLHNCGIVFYRQGLFNDEIVLDQGWALEAVYAVFQREKCYRQLCALGGRFTRSLLESMVWQQYSPPEQQLFLSLMTSCGICFVHREANGEREAEYVAPDLLPAGDAVSGQLAGRWNSSAVAASRSWTYEFLHPGLVREVISKLGGIARESAVYWKYGIWAYETSTRASFILEQQMVDECRGKLVLQAQGDRPAELLQRVAKLVDECNSKAGCGKFTAAGEAGDIERTVRGALGHAAEDERRDGGPLDPPMLFADPPRPKDERRVCVSYAWKDERSKEPTRASKVEKFCADLSAAGIHVIRDTTSLEPGDRLSAFMRTIATGDVVFVFLSDAYLRSPNCMYELLQIWHGSQDLPDQFLGQIRVLPLPETKIHSIPDRLAYAAYWKKQRDDIKILIEQNGIDVLGPTDLKNWKHIQDFAHNVNEMLCHISDMLLERNFDSFIQMAIDEFRQSVD